MTTYLRSIWDQPVTFGGLLIVVLMFLLFQYLGRFTNPALREWWRYWWNR